jgi:hypothetical protein
LRSFHDTPTQPRYGSESTIAGGFAERRMCSGNRAETVGPFKGDASL